MMKVLLVLAAVCVVVNGSAFEKGDKGALACDKIKIGHTQHDKNEDGEAINFPQPKCLSGDDIKTGKDKGMAMWMDRPQ